MSLKSPVLVVVCFVLSFTSSAMAQTGPRAAWAFEEAAGTSAADSTGNGHTGALQGSPTWTTGRVGGALSFDGVNDRVEVADADDLDLTTSLTLSAWIKLTAQPTWRGLLWKESSTTNLSYGLLFDGSSKLHAYLRLPGGIEMLSLTSQLPLDAWTHIALTYDCLTHRNLCHI